MKPVRLPAAATLALPRWGLIALCLLYILPGIIRRDPWKVDDAAGFGIMWTMAHGTLADWLLPNIAGLAMPNEAPLAFWIGALLIKVFGWLTGDALAARLSTVVFFAIGASAIWHTAFLLGRRSEAQPLQLAFGGQPAALDFGRTLADGALLIYIASLGLLLRSHETAAPALAVSLVALIFLCATRLFDQANLRAAAGLGLSLGLLSLTRGGSSQFLLPALLTLALVLLSLWRYRSVTPLLIGVSLPLAVLLPSIWLATRSYMLSGDVPLFETSLWSLQSLNLPSFVLPKLSSVGELLKLLGWFTWPAWPIAAWAVLAWRRQRALHILLPSCGIVALLLMALFTAPLRDGDLLALLPPLAILAAFGLPTLKRGAINAIDWFSVMTLSAIAGFIWLGWIAKQTGWPTQLAKNAFRLAPGFQPEFNAIALLIALGSTIGWLLLMRWRLGRRPSVLWRAVVLSTGGLVLCWLLLMTLWLPWLNYGQSYAPVAEKIDAHLPSNYRCVEARGVGPAQRASFAYLGNVRFARAGDKACEYLLVQDDGLRKPGAAIKKMDANLTLLWQGRRASDKRELFRLFKRDTP